MLATFHAMNRDTGGVVPREMTLVYKEFYTGNHASGNTAGISINGDGSKFAFTSKVLDTVWIRERSGNTWNLTHTFTNTNNEMYWSYIIDMNVDGNRLIIYSNGNAANNYTHTVHVYDYNGSGWNEINGIEMTGITNSNSVIGANQSIKLSRDGNTLYISFYYRNTVDASLPWYVYVYEYNGSSWTKITDISFPNNSLSGFDIIDNLLICGLTTGSVHVYELNNNTLTQKDTIIYPRGPTTISTMPVYVNINSNYRMVLSLSQWGNYSGAANHFGKIFIYDYNGSTWDLVTEFPPDGYTDFDGEYARFGTVSSINQNGDIIVSSAYDEKNEGSGLPYDEIDGRSYLFSLNGGNINLVDRKWQISELAINQQSIMKLNDSGDLLFHNLRDVRPTSGTWAGYNHGIAIYSTT